MNEYNPADDTAYRRAVRTLNEARWPTECSAAVMLAAAQRDLATARASSPEEIAGEPGVSDPDAAYAAWVERMVGSERSARDGAVSSVAAGYRDDDAPDPARRPVDAEFAAEFAAAVARARAAVAAMTGPDPIAAQAAWNDVLGRWPDDDQTAAAALAARFTDPEPEA